MIYPSLPQLDDNPQERVCQLLQAKRAYQYDYTYPRDIAMVREVPPAEQFTKGYLAHAMKLNLELNANQIAADMQGIDRRRRKVLSYDLPGLLATTLKLADRFTFGKELAQHPRSQRPHSLADYERMFALIRRTPMVDVMYSSDSQNSRAQNLAFAWQRIAGANPMELRSWAVADADTAAGASLSERFPIDEATFHRALDYWGPIAADGYAAITLDKAKAEGRLFVADYYPLAALPQSTRYHQRERYMCAPIALFMWLESGHDELPGQLVPIAIQCHQKPGAGAPIMTPADGWAWVRARTYVQIADGNMHEAVRHLGETHLVMESIIIAAMRCLAERHPLRLLLEPHFEFTLALNNVAKHDLIAPGGVVASLLAPPLEDALGAVHETIKTFDLRASVPTTSIAARGVGEEVLPRFPYRDDADRVFPLIEAFVDEYVGLYYQNEDDVRDDHELHHFMREAAAGKPKGGGLEKGLGEMTEVAHVKELMAAIIWTASAQHGCLNFAQFPYMGPVPNMPGAGYKPPPSSIEGEDEKSFLDTLPPLDLANLHFNMVYELSNVRANILGDYPRNHFIDPRVRELVVRFQRKLARADKEIAAIDADRPIPYPYLRPSQTTASIHI